MAFEPFKPDFDCPGVPNGCTLDDTIKSADAILLLVGHTELKALNPTEIAWKTSARVVIDCVNG